MFIFKKTRPRLLMLADYQNPILRKVTCTVTFPLSEEDKEIIEAMKHSIKVDQLKKANAPFKSASGMAANQWGIDRQIFIFCPRGESHGPEVIINPSYHPINENKTEESYEFGWEGCFSIPLSLSYVKRHTVIKAEYQNEAGVHCEKILSHWTARIWQHETDHLNGLLADDIKAGKCLEKRMFSSLEALNQFEDAKEAQRQSRDKEDTL